MTVNKKKYIIKEHVFIKDFFVIIFIFKQSNILFPFPPAHSFPSLRNDTANSAAHSKQKQANKRKEKKKVELILAWNRFWCNVWPS